MERDFSEIDRNYANTSEEGIELEFHPDKCADQHGRSEILV